MSQNHIHRLSVGVLAVMATILVLLFLLPPLSVEAVSEPPPENALVGAAMVCNIENNQTLYEKNLDARIYPSSSVKIMTGMLACRALRERQGEVVTITASMVNGVEGRRMNPPLAEGECLTIRSLLEAAIGGGYNDAASVVACLASGSIAAFIQEMNEEAARLGTKLTNYTNVTGLHDPAMSTSVRDVSIIAREAYRDDLYMEVSSADTYLVPATNIAPDRPFRNRNYLISSSDYLNGYCRGMNAGMTDEGGWCVVTVCERGGANNLCIVMCTQDGGEDAPIPAYTYTNELLAWANRAYAYRTVLAAGEVYDTSPVSLTGISKSEAELVPTTDLKIYLSSSAMVEEGALSYQTVIEGGKLSAPLRSGDVVGTVTVSYGGRVVGRADLTVTEDFDRNAFVGGMMAFRGYLTGRAFWITVPLFIVSLLLFLRATSGTHGRYGIRSARRRKRVRYKRRRY